MCVPFLSNVLNAKPQQNPSISVYQSKAQSIVALSSTEAELVAAVTTAKTARYNRSVMSELGYLHKKDQLQSTRIMNQLSQLSTLTNPQRNPGLHIDIWLFAIQDWKTRGAIELFHILVAINPADDLTS